MPIKLNSTGGGSVTLDVPSMSTANTLTLPAKSGNIITSADTGTVSQAMLGAGVAGNGPAFSAYISSNQSITNNTFTKLQAGTEEFDTANCYDSATNYRFTPNVAGYYHIIGQIYFYASGNLNTNTIVSIFKNGVRFKDGNLTSGTQGVAAFYNASALIYLNGSTDYVELYGLINGAGTVEFRRDGGSQAQSYFQGFLARAA